MMDSTAADAMAMVKCGAENMVSKSLQNIVGNLWQAKQESSGSSMGNQSPRNGDDLSDAEPASPPDRDHHLNRRNSLLSTEEPEPLDGTNLDNLSKFPSTEKTNGDILSDENDKGGGVRLKDPRELLTREEKDARQLLAGLPHLPNLSNLPHIPASLEALQRHRESLLSSPHSILSVAAAGLHTPPGLNFTPLPRPPSQPNTPTPSQNSGSPIQQPLGSNGNNSNQQNWSFEEQFKQLYEIDDNPKRKEFLDDLFLFMQKRGTPINRLPIMAKQVLDLYELFNLVIARGGLVEVINKKLWQEVIKGLGLPSSITSAAFTLRTQYTKYLYPLECNKKNLSNPNELQAAIEGNKREGRRTSYGAYPDMLPHPFGAGPGSAGSPLGSLGFPTPPPRSLAQQLNGSSHLPPSSHSPPNPLLYNGKGSSSDPLSAIEMTRLALWKMYNQNNGDLPRSLNLPVSLPNLPVSLPHEFFGDKATSLQQRALEEAVKRDASGESLAKLHKDVKVNGDKSSEVDEEEEIINDEEEEVDIGRLEEHERKSRERIRRLEDLDIDPNGNSELGSPAKRRLLETGIERTDKESTEDARQNDKNENTKEVTPRKQLSLNQLGMQGANIKITSRGDAGDNESSLVVSLEINGTSYQGVLFAQQKSAVGTASEESEEAEINLKDSS